MASKQRQKGKSELSEDQKAEIEEAFRMLDFDKDGYISTKDIKIALRSIGFEPTKKEILHMIGEVDPESDGMISLPLFTKMMTKKRDEMDPEEEIRRAFRLFADDSTEGIRASDIKRVAIEIGENLTDEELKDIIEEADRDNDGIITFEDFANVMRKTSMF
jgi:centrin-1